MKDELPPETVRFLAELSREDIATLKTGLPLIRMVVSFGKVTKWLTITLGGLILGAGDVHVWECQRQLLQLRQATLVVGADEAVHQQPEPAVQQVIAGIRLEGPRHARAGSPGRTIC